MQPGFPRTRFTGPALVRLLDRLAAPDVPAARQGFAERLSQWLKWTDAIPLSSALNAGPAARSCSAGRRVDGEVDEVDDVERLRQALIHAITSEPVLSTERRRGASAPMATAASASTAGRLPAFEPDMPADFPAFRRLYLAKQQLMATAIAPLRERLRASLCAVSPDLAHLAALDAVMERVIGTQEQTLLAGIPSLLEPHFRRLHQAHGADADTDAGGARLAVFAQDLRAVLLAELELRLQPVQGLLAALRARTPVTP